MPPTQSTAAAQRCLSSARIFASGSSGSRPMTDAAPSEVSRSFASALPLEAITSKPRAASRSTLTLPTPPLAPVTSTGPASGVRPRFSRACTLNAAVNPAVPMVAACLAVRPSSFTTQSPGTRAYSA